MPIITDSNAIPKEFITRVIQISDNAKNRLKNALKIDEFIPNQNEILDLVFKTSLDCCELHFNKKKSVSFTYDYIRNGLDVRSGESSIFMNIALIESLSHFITVVIYHALDFDNREVSLYCYRQLLFIMNEECNNTYTLPPESKYIELIEKFFDKDNSLQVSTDLFWGMITFLILHELSHIFLNHFNKEQTIAEQEYEADREAYLILLEMIYNKGLYKGLKFLKEYIYLTPMMIIDFFTLVTFVDGTINGTRYKSYHPSHEKRKDFLFELFNNWDRDFYTEEGNGLYNWYIEVVERFKNDVYNANEQGMLKSLKRNKEKEMNEENTINFISQITDELTCENMMHELFDKVSIGKLIDTHVCFIADNNKKDFVLISLKNGSAKSFKLTNIIINFKDMLDMLIDIALISTIPSSDIQMAKFVLFLAYKIFGLSTKNLSESAAKVLLFLHRNNAYSKYINEDEIIKHLYSQDSVGKDIVNTAINDLSKVKCIDIVQGDIILLEKVYLK
jgi:hypothetical protein